jgi:hypothetical protein
MPFSDDEQIIVVEKSKFKSFILITAFGLFTISLFSPAFCTKSETILGIFAFLFGWFNLINGGIAFFWLANPLLIIAWILISKNRKSAWIISLMATIVSLLFMKYNFLTVSQVTQINSIVEIKQGYWFWLSSCVITFIGSLTIRIFKY